MRKGIVIFLLLALFLVFGTDRVWAEELSPITVKNQELNNGVVILEILKAGKVYELRCNRGFSACTPLSNGKYAMVELPKNFGMYVCRNVDVYPESTASPETAKRLGQYCLTEKQ